MKKKIFWKVLSSLVQLIMHYRNDKWSISKDWKAISSSYQWTYEKWFCFILSESQIFFWKLNSSKWSNQLLKRNFLWKKKKFLQNLVFGNFKNKILQKKVQNTVYKWWNQWKNAGTSIHIADTSSINWLP